MPADRPPADDLDWTDQGPRSRRFGDVYYSLQDGLAESRAVFLHGCGLPDAWGGRDRFVVGELGFGTGLNIVSLLALWAQTREPAARLSVFSVEAHPLSAEDAARALKAWPELAPVADLLLARWPRRAQGFHRLDLPELGATIDLAVGDAVWALDQWLGRADAWFLDGFAPSNNPAMWSLDVLDGITARSAPAARAATFTVAGAVRRGLSERGWQVDKRPGHGRKRERLEASLAGAPTPIGPPPRIAIIGAGIAGASVARALTAFGVAATVIEAHRPGAGASGFPAALVTPRVDVGDDVVARLGAQGLARAADLYAAVEGAVVARGVLRLEQAPRDVARHARIAAQDIWAPGAMTPLSAIETRSRTGEQDVEIGGLDMAEALAIAPAAVLDAWLNPHDRITANIARMEPERAGGWRLLDADGALIVQADAVVLAGGWDGAALLADLAPSLALSPVRGQADWSANVAGPAVSGGGYAAPLEGGGLLWGATHDRGDTDRSLRPGDVARNLRTLSAILPSRAQGGAGEVQSRAAIRAVTPDRLPVCGPVAGATGLWLLTGLGSRGFSLAPLLGEHLAARLLDAPSPLPRDLAERIDPARKSVKLA